MEVRVSKQLFHCLYWDLFQYMHICMLIKENSKQINRDTYFGTATNNVVKYSEFNTQCSFFMMPFKFLTDKLPLDSYVTLYIEGVSKWYTIPSFHFSLSIYPFQLNHTFAFVEVFEEHSYFGYTYSTLFLSSYPLLSFPR